MQWHNAPRDAPKLHAIHQPLRVTCLRLLLQPQSPEAYANLASAFKDSGRHDEAINTYRQVSRRGPEATAKPCCERQDCT